MDVPVVTIRVSGGKASDGASPRESKGGEARGWASPWMSR